MPRRCNDLCRHLPHVKSLRWVTSKHEYKYCSKCAKYFKAGPRQIQCECCKDTLRVYYRLQNIPRRRELFRYKIDYLLNQSHVLLTRLIHAEIHGWPKSRGPKKNYWKINKDRYNANRRAKYLQKKNPINVRPTITDLQMDVIIGQSPLSL